MIQVSSWASLGLPRWIWLTDLLPIFQCIRELTTKVDKLEASDAQRQKEGEQTEQKPIIMPEPQLMITAGPMGMVPQQYANAYAGVQQGYPQQMPPYQGYGM